MEGWGEIIYERKGTEKRRGKEKRDSILAFRNIGCRALIVFVVAISYPDYLNYRYRVTALKAANAQSAVETNGTLPQPFIRTNGMTLGIDDVPIKSSDIFETYGKLLTMLLGFISVLGIFFGYFVRRSLREVEDDMRTHVNANMELWSKERDRMSSDVEKKLAEINKQRDKLTALTKEFNSLVSKAKNSLEVLDKAAKGELDKLKPSEPKTSKIANAIDEDPTIPGV